MGSENQKFLMLSNEWSYSTSRIRDIQSLADWQKTWLHSAIPHTAILCIQSVRHSGGYTAVQRWGTGLPSFYENFVSCAGNNIRSPIHAQMIASGAPVFFDLETDRSHVPALWASQFERAELQNVAGLSYLDNKNQENELLTTIGLYNVPSSLRSSLTQLQHEMMPHLHQAISLAFANKSNLVKNLNPTEINLITLVFEGKSNKEIGKKLGKSDETIKARLATLMRRYKVRNRIELAKLLMFN